MFTQQADLRIRDVEQITLAIHLLFSHRQVHINLHLQCID